MRVVGGVGDGVEVVKQFSTRIKRKGRSVDHRGTGYTNGLSEEESRGSMVEALEAGCD